MAVAGGSGMKVGWSPREAQVPLPPGGEGGGGGMKVGRLPQGAQEPLPPAHEGGGGGVDGGGRVVVRDGVVRSSSYFLHHEWYTSPTARGLISIIR